MPLSVLDRPTGTDAVRVHLQTAVVKVWRVACATGAALLMRVEDPRNPGNPANFVFPHLAAHQGGTPRYLIANRVDNGSQVFKGADSTVSVNTVLKPGYRSGMYDTAIDLDGAFSLGLNDGFGNDAFTPYSLSIPAYAPTPDTYPEAFGPRPINGRYAGNFFDPAKPGEGIVVEIGDVPGQPDTHFLQFAWHSFDNNGAPFWISGGETFTGRPTRLHMPAAYRSGGRFGGARPADTQTTWGSVEIAFTDCGHAVIDYQARSGLPASVPAGSGHLQWQRLTGISGYSCD